MGEIDLGPTSGCQDAMFCLGTEPSPGADPVLRPGQYRLGREAPANYQFKRI